MRILRSDFDLPFTECVVQLFNQQYRHAMLMVGTMQTSPLVRYWFQKFSRTQEFIYVVLHVSDEFDYSPDSDSYQCVAFTEAHTASSFFEESELETWSLDPDFQWVGSILIKLWVNVGSALFSSASYNDLNMLKYPYSLDTSELYIEAPESPRI